MGRQAWPVVLIEHLDESLVLCRELHRCFCLRCNDGCGLRSGSTRCLLASLLALPFQLLPTRLRGLRFSATVGLSVLLLIGRILIGKQPLPVDVLHITHLRDEVGVVSVLRLRIAVVEHTQNLSHLVGIILQVAPFLAGLEHYLDALTAWRDKNPQDAQILEVLTLEPLLNTCLHVGDMVGIEHRKTCQIGFRLHTPQSRTPPAVGTLGKVGCEDDGRQSALQLRDVELHTLQVVAGHTLFRASRVFLQFAFQPILVILQKHDSGNIFVQSITGCSVCHISLSLAVSVNSHVVLFQCSKVFQHLFRQILSGLIDVY